MTTGLQGQQLNNCDNFFYDLGQDLLRRKLTMSTVKNSKNKKILSFPLQW